MIDRSSQSEESDAGFIVVVVLWILAILSSLVSIYFVYVINTAAGFADYEDNLRVEALTSAAVELTAARQLNVPGPTRPSKGQFRFKLGAASAEVTYEAESSRVDLNTAPKELLAGLMASSGTHDEDAKTLADHVIGWRASGQNSGGGLVANQSDKLNHSPRGGKFSHTHELSLIREIPTALLERILPFVTVYSGMAQINVLDAAPQVIAALPSMSPDRLRSFLSQRLNGKTKPEALLASLGPAERNATLQSSNAIRISVQIELGRGRRSHSELVILLLPAGAQPFAILSPPVTPHLRSM